MSKSTTRMLLIIGGGIAAYLLYRNYVAADAGSNANANMGGVDFGVLDPSSW